MPKPNSDCRATERKHPWPMVRLGDVCELKNGYTPSASMLSEKEGIPYFRVSAMNFSGNEKFLKVPNAYCVDQGKRVFPAGAVVFPKNGGAAQTHKVRVLANESIVDLNTGLAIPRECICSEYLYYWFEDLPINDYIIVGAIPFVDFGMLGDRKIPLPPLSVQREIVARLERELAAVEKIKKGFETLAETAKAEFKAELKEVFEEISRGGAETRRLGEVCEKIGSGATPLGGKKTYIENGTSLIRSQNVIDFSFSFLGLAHISETQAAQLDSVSVFDGDVLVNITGDSVARVCIVDNRCLPARVNQHVAIIRLSHSANVLNRYLEACLVAMKDELLKESVKGSTRKALTKD